MDKKKEVAEQENSGLKEQNLEALNLDGLSALTEEIISRQATINIGTIGHVAHGKSTVVKAISGVLTVRFKPELIRNITIKLGYANAKLYKCSNPDCPRPECYAAMGSAQPDTYPCPREGCDGSMELKRHISFVDCPGHDILMATMLNGAAVMDAALLLISANDPCPQPQTSEHLAAIEIMKLNSILILQNKIDLVKRKEAVEQHRDIMNFVKATAAEKSPIIPISAQLKYNIDIVVEYLIEHIPVPLRDFTSPPKMIVIRSFDVNKPGTDVDELIGGVAGGSLLQGVLKVGDEIEVRPGVISKIDGKFQVKPIRSQVVSLQAEDNELQYAIPGGLIGVGTKIDPTLCRSDRLVGFVLGAPGHLPDVYIEIEVNFFLLRRLLGVQSKDKKKNTRVMNLMPRESLWLNIGSTSVGAVVKALEEDVAMLSLLNPVCTEINEKIAISRRVDKHWRLIGWGKIISGSTIEVSYD